MDLELFGKSPIGRLVPISGTDARGRPYDHFAYVPQPLPDEIELSAATWNVVAQAGIALGRLDGEGRRLLNPSNLARPQIREEAISSSALEGTFTTLPQVLQGELLEREQSSDVREVLDHIAAAELGFAAINQGQPLSINLIRRLHARLMLSDRQCPASEKGEIRQRQNFVGPRPDSEIAASFFVPPPPGEELRQGLFHWERWIHGEDINLLVRMAVGHYQFEALHPFFDGNGRVGRLAAVLLLLHTGDLSVPLLNISPYLEVRRTEYREHLRNVSVTGDFDDWVKFFCQGVKVQSESALEKSNSLLELREQMVRELRAKSVRGKAIEIAEDLVGFPVVTTTDVRDRYNISYQAASNAIGVLVEAGYLDSLTLHANRRVFLAPAVLQILEGI
ncbi:MAG: Fic family protein [Actinomycetota bacterium]